MDIEETGQAIVVRDASSNQEAFRIAIGFGGFVAGLFGLLIVAGWMFDGVAKFADDLWGLMFAVLAVFALIAIAALFDQRIECRFDLSRKQVEHVREYWFWPLSRRIWTRQTGGTLSEAAGIGLAEQSTEDGYSYKPILTWGERRLPLALRSGSYIELDRKLARVRGATGLAKRDHG